MWNTSTRILFSHTPIEYFMSVFEHGYCSELVLYSPVEDFTHVYSFGILILNI